MHICTVQPRRQPEHRLKLVPGKFNDDSSDFAFFAFLRYISLPNEPKSQSCLALRGNNIRQYEACVHSHMAFWISVDI